MKNLRKRFLGTLLTIALVFTSMSMTAFAAEPEPAVTENATVSEDVAVPEVAPQANEDDGIMPLSASGYAADYTDHNTGSFKITVTGSALASTVRLKAWSFSSDAKVYVSLYRPNNNAAFTDYWLPLEELKTKTVYNVSAGDWYLHYYIIGDGRGWVNCEFR